MNCYECGNPATSLCPSCSRYICNEHYVRKTKSIFGCTECTKAEMDEQQVILNQEKQRQAVIDKEWKAKEELRVKQNRCCNCGSYHGDYQTGNYDKDGYYINVTWKCQCGRYLCNDCHEYRKNKKESIRSIKEKEQWSKCGKC